ncbi:MAG TPA: radical SAM protein [Methanocorpusculum sp.]|nr:radical SAM protein [Methanocorpusculum sp.]
MRITETFVSLQGEGKNQGRPCFFVRLSGCNLRCKWCDTEYSFEQGTDRHAEDIFEEIIKSSVDLVCITGGEPLLQKRELLPLLEALSAAGIETDIETNGTISFTECQPFASVCMDIKCPSSGNTSEVALLSDLTGTDCVKFVIADETDYAYMTEILKTYPQIPAEVMITPVYGTDTTWLVERIIAERLPVRFQIQLHKLENIQ